MAKKTGERQLELGGVVPTPRKEKISAANFLPTVKTLPNLRESARGCKGCPLWEHATQTVFGAGPERPLAMFVGEQPGNEEDHEGLPFVGPAGRLLDSVLEEVGIDRARIYVTNAVKHFKYEPRGKRRIHQKPSASEIWACKPWLDEEIRVLQPQVIVALGASAAQALFGKTFKITEQRGHWIPTMFAPKVMATMHPSALLRARGVDEDAYHRQKAELIADLKKVAEAIG